MNFDSQKRAAGYVFTYYKYKYQVIRDAENFASRLMLNSNNIDSVVIPEYVETYNEVESGINKSHKLYIPKGSNYTYVHHAK